MGTWKSGTLPELTCPVTLATMLKLASMVPSKATQRSTCQSFFNSARYTQATVRTEIQPKLGYIRRGERAGDEHAHDDGGIYVGTRVEGDG